jgi:pimeloyl-ACP methyl ester carboxylesterase
MAYALPARAIAEAGYLVVIVPMPLNLAVFDSNAAERVITAYPGVTHWAVGGHSLGGAMAARFADDNPGAVEGVVLWAAYPDASDDLSEQDLVAASIYGTLDGLATVETVEGARDLLPADTAWVPIKGGNHAQFGWYGEQARDNPATIGRDAQQAQVVEATVAVLAALAE